MEELEKGKEDSTAVEYQREDAKRTDGLQAALLESRESDWNGKVGHAVMALLLDDLLG